MYPKKCQLDLLKIKKIADLKPSLTSKAVKFMVNCARWIGHYCKIECGTSGKYTPCIISITWAGHRIMVAGWPLVTSFKMAHSGHIYVDGSFF